MMIGGCIGEPFGRVTALFAHGQLCGLACIRVEGFRELGIFSEWVSTESLPANLLIAILRYFYEIPYFLHSYSH